MAQSRFTKLKGELYEKNVEKRGNVSSSKKKNSYPVGPFVLGLFVFVVIGSAVIQMIVSATTKHLD
ncbi:stress associated endoplasmic reticulum [Cryptosporidium sp. chipmunk genotype I]|uniref:stress associated endoplasmic reticulum n=1 Tax=Cryptosporidium sp. chipmunk genotype I TaxID=1280935 RepID=UPI00351A1E01|nr:stress associated endoplasmic reticulum [Cryptosporidium sp. chipmunk genotype I]